jgi:putative transposase
VESFHSRQRDECLNLHIFGSLAEARATIVAWHKEYNTLRPHSVLGYKTPAAYYADYAAVAQTPTPTPPGIQNGVTPSRLSRSSRDGFLVTSASG